MSPPKHNLLGLTHQELIDYVLSIGEPRYRAKQLYLWLYAKSATSFSGMTDLGKAFRSRLENAATIEGLSLVTQQRSTHDGTTKFLFVLPDNLKIESVLIPPASAFAGKEAAQEDEQKRLTLCVSTQVGCPLGCKFCATATMGYVRNLSVGEIVDQILQVKRITGKRITNIVFMGMGEPLMNYENVVKAVEIISTGMGIAAKRITVSTAGWADKIKQMGDERCRVKLAISLHSAVDETRSKLMPINKKFSLATLMSAVENYYARTKQRVTYEYIFFDGVNDTEREVERLIKLARRVPSKINVIPYHSIDFTQPAGFSASLRPSRRTETIVEHLRASNLTVMVRSSAGEDIDAACGQLAVKTGNVLNGQMHRPIKAPRARREAQSSISEKNTRILPIQTSL
jgi:23S rRNA (adenine2503-C2)-methyltransferase